MALGAVATATNKSEICRGQASAHRVQFAGDDAYVAGGTPAFTAYLISLLDEKDTPNHGSRGPLEIVGIAGSAVHDAGDALQPQYWARYDAELDALFIMDGAAEVAAGDLSALKITVTVLTK